MHCFVCFRLVQLSAAELSIKKAELEGKALGVQIKEQEALLPELREAAQAAPSEDQAGVLKKLAADINKANQILEKVGVSLSLVPSLRPCVLV